MSIEKSTTETYTLRGDKCLWAKINLDCGEKSVNVMISSDYGDFNHYWGGCGENPKKFLIDLDWHYCMKKLMNSTSDMHMPDFDEREIEFKKLIIENRREHNISKDIVREQWNRMLEIFGECGNSDELYYSLCFNESLFWNDDYGIFWDSCSIPDGTKLKPIVKQFFNDVWTPFTQYLEEELKDSK